MTGPQGTGQTANRRTVVVAAGAAGLTAALTACGGDPGGKGSDPRPAGTVLGKVSEVPVGGGVVIGNQRVVVTQPAAGEFKAFSSTCTHQGCQVRDVSGGTINCPCHQSAFAITDGRVEGGPATQPLPAVRITVDGDSIKLG